MPCDIHFFQFAPHFLGNPVGLGAIGLAHRIGGREALSKGSCTGFREIDAFNDFRNGDNQVSLSGEDIKKIFGLSSSNKKNFPAKIFLKRVKKNIQPLLVRER